ncbi:hypothetical protein LTR53_009120 [Teratosphaeriaceae sp. CCFEE 6253]|nr:hypothetical protein LTR53_009120 [Teratosphaeriaceae sp. CCFEE 6253]
MLLGATAAARELNGNDAQDGENECGKRDRVKRRDHPPSRPWSVITGGVDVGQSISCHNSSPTRQDSAMGRLATHIAAIATDAENLPTSQRLPNVSFIDALLPRRYAELGTPRRERKVCWHAIASQTACGRVADSTRGAIGAIQWRTTDTLTPQVQPGSPCIATSSDIDSGSLHEGLTVLAYRFLRSLSISEMTRNHLTGILPFRLIPINADTGKPQDSAIGRKQMVTYYDIKKDKSGKRSIVAHKSSPSEVDDKPSGEAKRKDGNGKGKNGNGGADKSNQVRMASGWQHIFQSLTCHKKSDDREWTADDDAKLKSMKADNKTNKEIAEALNRDVGQIKKRWKEIGPGGEGGKADGEKDDAGGNKGKDDGKKLVHRLIDRLQNPNGREWIADEDTQLKALKAAGKEWKEIGQIMKRGQGQVKDRWRKIGDGGDGGDGGKAETKRNDKKKSGDSKKVNKKPKPSSKAGSAHGGEARFTMNEWITLQEDSLFSFGELQCLSELIMKDQNQTWLRIAGSFYDRTGRRVHPDDIREKFEEMARMG